MGIKVYTNETRNWVICMLSDAAQLNREDANSCVYRVKTNRECKYSHFFGYILSANANFLGLASDSNYNTLVSSLCPGIIASGARMISGVEASLDLAGCETQTTFPTSEVKSATGIVVEDVIKAEMAFALSLTGKGGEA